MLVGKEDRMWKWSRSVMSASLRPHVLQHARPPCPSPTPGVYSDSCPLSRWCHPTISSSVIPFFSCLQSFPASGSFLVSQFFASGGQSIGISASTLSNITWPCIIYDVGRVLVIYGLYYVEICSFCAYLLGIFWILFHWILCVFLMPLPHSFN